MNLAKFLSGAALLALLAPLAAGPVVLIDQDFGNKKFFPAGQAMAGSTGNSRTTAGNWNRFDGKNFTIVQSPSDAKAQAVRIVREAPANLTVFSTVKAPAGDSRILLRVRTGNLQKCAFSIRFYDGAVKQRFAFLRFLPGGRITSTVNNKEQAIGEFQPDAVQNFEFIVPAQGTLGRMRIYAQGATPGEFTPFPIEKGGEVSALLVSNAQGGAEPVYLEKLELARDTAKSVLSRANIAPMCKVTVRDAQKNIATTRLNDGDLAGDTGEPLRGLPAEILLELPQGETVSTLRLHTGIANYLQYPSGDLSATKYQVEVFSTAAGKWREIDVVSDAPRAKSVTEGDANRYSQLDVSPIEITRMRIRILDSSDTGKRAAAVNPPKTAVIREVEIFGIKDSSQSISGLATVLQAEFRVPVYRDQKKAGLHAILDKSVPALTVEISMRDRNNGFVPAPPRQVVLKPGENIIDIDISSFPNGEFLTLLRAADKKAQIFGEFARLLRIDRVPPVAAPDPSGDFTGKRMYFPDFRYATAHDNVVCRTFPPENHPLNKPFLEPEKFVQLGGAIGFDAAGNLVMKFNDRDWKWQNSKEHYAVTPYPKFEWRVQDTMPEGFKPEWAPITKLHCEDYSASYRFNTPESMKGRTFRFYDPERDGKPDLRQLRIVHTGYQPQDWGCVKVKPQTTWVIWAKGSGEYVLMHRKPFLSDGISAEEFEDPDNTNDNFAGQWVSADGKTLFYVRGRMLKRYPPFNARYDNLWMGARMQAIFSTHDGINFERHYFLPPDESDPPTGQQYGATIYRAPQGDGLMVAFLLPYSALHQQYYPELVYSWDGETWQRFPGHPAWIPAGKPGEWNFGLLNYHNNILARDNKYFHVIGWACAVPHCHAEVRRLGARDKITAEFIRGSFGPRNLENWPYFEHYGSWERLAEAWRSDGSHCGVSVYRQDGWFGLTAPGGEGSMTTCEVSAKGGLSANVEVKEGGFCRISAIDKNGKTIALADLPAGTPAYPGDDGKDAKLVRELPAGTDGVAVKVFDKLPAEPFRLRVELKNAVLYSLNF